jgi:hypothetical protein
MGKKILITTFALAGLVLAYWLISPLWRDVTLDEAPPTIEDNLEVMDTATRMEFERQTDAMSEETVDRSEAMPLQPTVLASGEMVARAHAVQGRALVLDTGTTRYLRFEDLETVNGPDLRIYLSANLSASNRVDLGPIRATHGNVNYTIPPGTDISTYRYAMIWCRAFGVLFSYAVLR